MRLRHISILAGTACLLVFAGCKKEEAPASAPAPTAKKEAPAAA